MLTGTANHSFDRRNGLQIVAPANFRLRILFDRAEQLGHRARESVRKPDLFPAWLEPVAGPTFGSEIERTGRARRIVGPSDRAACQPICSLDAPTYVNIAFGPL